MISVATSSLAWSDALTPAMSAPALASAYAAALPMPRRQPVTSAVRPARSNGAGADGLVAHAWQSTRIFIADEVRDCSSNTAGRRSSGSTAVMRRSSRKPAVLEECDGSLVVLCLVHPRSAELELLPEEVEEADRLRLREDRDEDDPSPQAREPRHLQSARPPIPRPRRRRRRRHRPVERGHVLRDVDTASDRRRRARAPTARASRLGFTSLSDDATRLSPGRRARRGGRSGHLRSRPPSLRVEAPRAGRRDRRPRGAR